MAFAAQAQTVGGRWEVLGPGPILNGQVEGIDGGEVVGAVNTIAAHPTDADVLFAGGANGGIWRTDNATALSPTWVSQAENIGSLAIGAIEFDPTDPSHQTLIAGTAQVSSVNYGGPRIGMLRTTDGGANWQLINPDGVLDNRDVFGVAARGSILVAGTSAGVYRSTDSGDTLAMVSGAPGTGLPVGKVADLASDPSNIDVLYVPVTEGSARGIYRSGDRGATWVKVSDQAIDDLLNMISRKTEIAVGNAGQVYVGIIERFELVGVFRSADGLSPWTSLGLPTTVEEGGVAIGIHAGGQGYIHFSIVADPGNSNIVYLGGDRQPEFGAGVPGSKLTFPNSIGANDYSGRLFRGDASLPADSRWVPLTHVGTANNSSPHADSRDMAFDALGNLIESSDGGVYKRTQPGNASGVWVSINGSLQTTEYRGADWDAVSGRVMGGAQDNGTSESVVPASAIFDSVSNADGGDPAVQDRTSATQSTRYSSHQVLYRFQRRTVDAANNVLTAAFPELAPLAGSPPLSGQFYTPIAVHYSDPSRLIFGASNGVYETFDRGDTVALVSNRRVNAADANPMVYGAIGDPELIYFAADLELYLRSSASGGSFAQLLSLPEVPRDLDIDRDAPTRLFAMTRNNILFSSDGGGSFVDITGNLTALSPNGTLRTMAYLTGKDMLAVGTLTAGTFVSMGTSGFGQWQPLGTDLPSVPISELSYDDVDQLLVAATLGRGAWRLETGDIPVDRVLADGFEG
ncbi:MAG: hypothetical protein KDI71_04650 [Xanthomonadales bacterium]|nr:hypothetical protein [Xanthomonadales bacterium]